MTWVGIFAALDVRIASRAELLGCGATPRGLTAAVRFRHLIRVRRDHYALPATPVPVLHAVRIGGRLGCVSALHEYGVFALGDHFEHVHLDRGSSRLRSPRHRFEPFSDESRDGITTHWHPLRFPEQAMAHVVGLRDALIQTVLCQHPRLAVASLDNALQLGLIDEAGLGDVFAALPARLQYLRPLVDGRSKSGQESVLRWVLREAGLGFEIQVEFAGIGRVDFLIEGRLVVEADSKLAHKQWSDHVRDRTRDLQLAQLNVASLRPLYQHIMFESETVLAAVLALLGRA